MICVALDVLDAHGIQEVVVNTHYLGEMLPRLVTPFVPPGMHVTYLHEPELLGTGGGIRRAREFLDDGEPFVVMNSDVVFQPDLRRAIDLHLSLGAVATMVLRSDPDAARYGAVEIDEQGQVRRLLGQPESGLPLRQFMFTGTHVLSPQVFDELPEQGCIVRHAYRRWVDDGSTIAGFVDESTWLDLGTTQRYLEASLKLVEKESLVSETARLDPDAIIDSCVIGDGARVGAHRLRRCIVWPDASIAQDLDNAIVTPSIIVRV